MEEHLFQLWPLHPVAIRLEQNFIYDTSVSPSSVMPYSDAYYNIILVELNPIKI